MGKNTLPEWWNQWVYLDTNERIPKLRIGAPSDIVSEFQVIVNNAITQNSRIYMSYLPQKRHYPNLSQCHKMALKMIEPSPNNGIKMWPCQVVLSDGSVIDNVYIAEASSYFNQFRIWPEDCNELSSIALSKVAKIKQSPNRMPFYIAKKLYDSGESGMGYLIFTIVFSDRTKKVYEMGNYQDFVVLPEDKTSADILEVIPHKNRSAMRLQGPKYFWCLFEEDK